MHMRRIVLLAACLAAAALLAIATSDAGARQLRISALGLQGIWENVHFVTGGRTVGCHMTLSGSFHSTTVAKIPHLHIGDLTRASVGSCVGGTATALTETLPWAFSYEAFSGRLPEIVGVNLLINGHRLRIRPEGSLACLLEGEPPARGILGIEARGGATEMTWEAATEIALTGEGGLCTFVGRAHLEGVGSVSALEGGLIPVRLI